MFSVYNAGIGSKGVHVKIPGKKFTPIRYVTGNTGSGQIYVYVVSDAAVQVPSWSYGAYLNFTDS